MLYARVVLVGQLNLKWAQARGVPINVVPGQSWPDDWVGAVLERGVPVCTMLGLPWWDSWSRVG